MSDIVKLRKDLEDVKKAADLSLVENAITYLRQLISRPAAVFDPFATMAALEQVVNVAREKGDDRASKYLVILRQCRPLTNSNALRSILTKLVASKEEAEVAKVVEKALKNSSPGRFARNGPPYPPYFNPRGRRGNPQFQRPRASVKCYTCGQFGHIARFCSKRPYPTL